MNVLQHKAKSRDSTILKQNKEKYRIKVVRFGKRAEELKLKITDQDLTKICKAFQYRILKACFMTWFRITRS